MTSFNPPTTSKKLHPVFSGLNEQQLATIYTEEQVKQLAAGECLFSEGDADHHTWLLIRGEIQIQQTRADMIYPLTRIEYQGQISRDSFMINGKRTATAIAREAVTVFVIDDDVLNKMAPEVQAIISRNMERELSIEINKLFASQAEVQLQNSQMTNDLTSLIQGQTSHYTTSSAVQDLLKRVPKLPPYACQLAGMLLNEDVSAREVTELARQDPSLTSAILKRVNSSYYGLSKKVTDFQHASLLLGFNQIHQIVINMGILKTMPDTGQFQRLQSHSVMISILSFEISQITNSGNGPVMNTIGLLHDIGKSVLLLLISQNPKLAFFISLLDPARIGALLLQNWEIPDAIYETLEYQKYPELLPPEAIPQSCRKKVAILYLAHLCQNHMSGNTNTDVGNSFLGDYFKLLKIREASLDDFIEKKLLTSVKKRLPTYPVEIQEFFANASTKGNSREDAVHGTTVNSDSESTGSIHDEAEQVA